MAGNTPQMRAVTTVESVLARRLASGERLRRNSEEIHSEEWSSFGDKAYSGPLCAYLQERTQARTHTEGTLIQCYICSLFPLFLPSLPPALFLLCSVEHLQPVNTAGVDSLHPTACQWEGPNAEIV